MGEVIYLTKWLPKSWKLTAIAKMTRTSSNATVWKYLVGILVQFRPYSDVMNDKSSEIKAALLGVNKNGYVRVVGIVCFRVTCRLCVLFRSGRNGQNMTAPQCNHAHTW